MITHLCLYCGNTTDDITHMCQEYLNTIPVDEPGVCVYCYEVIKSPFGCQFCASKKNTSIIIDEIQSIDNQYFNNLLKVFSQEYPSLSDYWPTHQTVLTSFKNHSLISLPGENSDMLTNNQQDVYTVEAAPFVVTFRTKYPLLPKEALHAYQGFFVELWNDGQLLCSGIIDNVNDECIYINLGVLDANGKFFAEEDNPIFSYSWKSEFDQIVVIS